MDKDIADPTPCDFVVDPASLLCADVRCLATLGEWPPISLKAEGQPPVRRAPNRLPHAMRRLS